MRPPIPPQASCAAYAHLLPLLADDAATPALADARAHAQTCAHCQQAIADYEHIDGTVLRHYMRYVPPPLTTEEIMDHIAASSPRAPVMPKPTFRQWAPVISATLVVALLIGSFAAFTHFARQQGQTPSDPSDAALTSISMISPTEGWAVKNPWLRSWDLNIPSTLVSSTLYHYQQGVWRPVKLDAPAYRAVRIEALHMFAANDGWALADAVIAPSKTREVILHYDGAHWIAPPDDGQILADHFREFVRFSGFQALSDTSLWLSMFTLSVTDGEAQLPAVAHLTNGHIWTIEELPLPPTLRGADTNLDPQALAMVNDDEGWLAARVSSGAGNGQGVGVLYHRLHGKWTIASISTTAMIDTLTLFSANDGWALGESLTLAPQPNGDPAAPILYRYRNGSWTSQATSVTEPQQGSVLHMLTAQDGWLFTNWARAKAFHFNGTAWTFTQDLSALVKVARLGGVTILAATFPAANDGWAVGYYCLKNANPAESYYPVIFHYTEGAWQLATI